MDLNLAREALHGPRNATAQYTEENIIWIGNQGFEASPEHIIVLRDEFRSGLECPRCLDKDVRNNVSMIECDNCHGKGFYGKNGTEFKCAACQTRGVIPCPDCGGKGGLLALPENTKDAPTTGVVVSVGAHTSLYQLADRVCFPSFAGHGFTITGEDKQSKKPVQGTIVILVERDILAKVHGVLEKKNIKQSMAYHTGA